MLVNAYGSPIPKADYASRFMQITQAWKSQDNNLESMLFHLLLFSFMKSSGTIDLVTMKNSMSDDPEDWNIRFSPIVDIRFSC